MSAPATATLANPVPTPAEELRVGMLLDLEGDSVADADGTRPLSRVGFQFELVRVEDLELETADCVLVTTDAGSFGFPARHMLQVCGEDTGEQ